MKLQVMRLLLGMEQGLAKLVTQGEKIMAGIQDLATKMDEIEATVTQQSTVIQSAIELINGLAAINSSLRQELADAIAANDPVAVQAVLDRMTLAETTTEQKVQALAQAVVAGTPAQG